MILLAGAPHQVTSRAWDNVVQQLHQVVEGAEHACRALHEIAAEPTHAEVVEAWRPVMQVVLELCAQNPHGEDPLEREERFARKLRSAIRQMPHFAFVEVTAR